MLINTEKDNFYNNFSPKITMIIILVISVFSLIVFEFWNLKTLRELKSHNSSENKELNDSKYFELKYKTEFLIAVFSVIVALAGLLGYNSLQNVKSEIKTEITKELDSVETRMKNTEKNILAKDSVVKTLDLKTGVISNHISEFESQVRGQKGNLNALTNEIDIINSKNIIKQNYYIVNSLKFNFKILTLSKFNFTDLKTNLGDRLPSFITPPLVIPISESKNKIDIWNITKNSFEVGTLESIGDEDTVKFSVVIFIK